MRGSNNLKRIQSYLLIFIILIANIRVIQLYGSIFIESQLKVVDDNFEESNRNPEMKYFSSDLGTNKIEIIGLNILAWVDNPSNEYIIEQLAINWSSEITIVNNQVDLFYELGLRIYDALILISFRNFELNNSENLVFDSNQLKLISEFVKSGGILICSDHIINYNPQLCDIVGIEQFHYTPYLPDMYISSDFYLVSHYLNNNSKIGRDGYAITTSSDTMVLAKHSVWNPPLIGMSKHSNVSEVSSGNDIRIFLEISNLGNGTAYKIKIEEYLNCFSILRSNLNFTAKEDGVNWTIEYLEPDQSFLLYYDCKAPPVDFIHEFELLSKIEYFDNRDRKYAYPDTTLLNYYGQLILPPIVTIEVCLANVLAWCDDSSDLFLINEVLDGRCSYNIVSKIQDLLTNLINSKYDILWLMNFGWIDFPVNLTFKSFCDWLNEIIKFYMDFNETCAQIINNWVKMGGKIICSDWSLNNYQNGISDIFGVKCLGGIPPIFFDIECDLDCDEFNHDHQWDCISAGTTWYCEKRIEWDWYHKIGISNNHSITEAFLGAILKSKSWAFEINFYPFLNQKFCNNIGIPEVLAYYYRPLWCKDEILDLNQPAIISSNYEKGRGVYFSMDIGRSAFRGYNSSAWIQLAINSLKWLSFTNKTPIIASNKDFEVPDPYLSEEFAHLVLTEELPSIILNFYGSGRAIYFTFDIGLLSLLNIDTDLWINILRAACYRMIQFESLSEVELNHENLEISYNFIAIGESIISIITKDVEPFEGIIFIDGEEIRNLDPYLNFTDFYFNFTTLYHEIIIKVNQYLDYFDGFKIKSLYIQKLCLIHQEFKNPQNTLEIGFKGSGYLKLHSNCQGDTITISLDGNLLCNNLPLDDSEPQFNLDFILEGGSHFLKIMGVNLIIENVTIISEVDCDGDELSSGNELILKSPIYQQNCWIFWESLHQRFSISESKQAGNNLKYSYLGKLMLVIPSSFNYSELYLQINSLSAYDYIKDIKIIDIKIYDEILSVGSYLLEQYIESGTYTIYFDFIEQVGDGFFDIEIILNKNGRFIKPIIVENNLYSDSDGDGLCDSNEINQDLDPYNPDYDADLLFDGLDISEKNYDILPGNSLYNYIFTLSEELITQNLRIDIQIQRPLDDSLYERTGLSWIDDGYIDIIPLLRIIGPYTYEGLKGDYLPNDITDNSSNYIALAPFTNITEYSYQTYFTYYSNETNIHPAFDDKSLEFTFDLVWGALLTNCTGGKQMLHIWPHPDDLIIQGLNLYHFSSLRGALLRVPSSDQQDYVYASYIFESQWGYETNYQINNIPEYLNGGIAYFYDVKPGQLKNAIFNTVENISDFVDGDFFVLVTEFNKTISTDAFLNRIIDKSMKYLLKTTIGIRVKKINNAILAEKFTFGKSYGFNLADEDIIKRISVTAVFEKNELDEWVLIFNKKSKTTIDLVDGTWSYRATRTNFPSDGGIDVIETRIYVNPDTDQYQIIEYFRHTDANGNLVYKERRIKQDWIDIPEEQVYDLDETLEQPLKKLTKLQIGLQIFNIIMSIITIISSTYAIIEAVEIYHIGIELMSLGGEFYWPGVAISIGAILIIISSVISITMAVIDIVISGLILAGVLSTNPISVWVGLAIFAISLIILLIGWLLIIFGQNNVPDYDTPSLRMVTEGEKAPEIEFDTKTQEDIFFTLSPEIGCGITLSYHFYVYDDPDISDEAYIQEHESKLTFGDNSYGLRNPENTYWNDNIFGIGYPAQRVTLRDTCNTWGPRVDAILQIKYQFYDDGISGACYYYIPLDLDFPVYPDNIQEFINYLENDNPYSRTREAVTVHINTDGGMDYQGVGDKKYALVGPTQNGPWYSLQAAKDPFSRPGYIKADSGAKDTWQAGFLAEDNVGYVSIINEDSNGDNSFDDWVFDKAAFSWNGNDWEWDTCVIRDYYKDLFGNVYYEDRTVDFYNFGNNLGLYCILDTHPTQILYIAARTDGFTLVRHADGRFHWYHF
ncbi:MAG: hypothetical protein ACFE9I_16400 [Candidatus Hermodarchaeota archaeon]